MKLITPTALAKLIIDESGIALTKQATHKAIKDGLIPFVLQGKKKMVDLDDLNIQAYISAGNRQREAVKKNEKKKPSKLPANKQLKQPTASGKETDNRSKNIDTSKFENLDPFEMKRRAQFADMRKRELQVLVMEKKYLPIDFIDGVYIKYIETLNSTIERLSSTYINDIGKKILDVGEVLPEHIEKYLSLVLEAIHNNKKKVKQLVKNYEPKL
jgi:hypothetical protein